MPVGAYGASSKIMSSISPDGNVYQAGTLSGNPVAMSAGIAQLGECLKGGFYEEMENKTTYFKNKIMDFVKEKNYNFRIFNIASIFWFAFTNKDRIASSSEIDPESMKYFRLLHGDLLENGIYLGPSGYEVGFISAAHSNEILEEAAMKICASLEKVFSGFKENTVKKII